MEVRFDGLVLLVELGQIGYDVFNHIGVGERVDLGLLLCVGGDTACIAQLADILSKYDLML